MAEQEKNPKFMSGKDMKCPTLGPDARWLVFGSRGWIGGMVVEMLTNTGATFKAAESRMENRESVEAEIKEFKATHILNLAGVTGRPNVDWCESHKEDTVRANVIGCLTLCDVAFKNNVHVTNMATGCIYHYDEARPQGTYDESKNDWLDGGVFEETDEPNFKGSWYSRTKGYVDRILLHSYDNVMTLRLRMPISDDLSPRNFVTKISRYERVVNIPNSMSVLYDLVPLMMGMANAKKTGLFNFTNPGVISHNQVLDLYTKYVDPEFTYKNFTLEEHDKVVIAKRSNNELSTKKLQAVATELEIPLPDIKTSVAESMKRMKENLAK